MEPASYETCWCGAVQMVYPEVACSEKFTWRRHSPVGCEDIRRSRRHTESEWEAVREHRRSSPLPYRQVDNGDTRRRGWRN